MGLTAQAEWAAPMAGRSGVAALPSGPETQPPEPQPQRPTSWVSPDPSADSAALDGP